MIDCVFCHVDLESTQKVIFTNDHCMFLQLDTSSNIGSTLKGAGVIVPKIHRETVFDLTEDEWNAMYELLQEVKAYLDAKHQPDGYNLGWNSGAVGGQHISHAHFHILPRYRDEPLAGKGIRYMFKDVNK